MALPTFTLLGQMKRDGAGGTSIAITTGAAAAAGTSILVRITVLRGGQNLAAGASDSGAANAYALDQQQNGTYSGVAYLSSHNIAALASGGTITVTQGASHSYVTATAIGIAWNATGQFGAFDAGGMTFGTSTSPTQSATAAAVIQDRAVFGGSWGFSSTSITLDAAWTAIAQQTADSGFIIDAPGYQLINGGTSSAVYTMNPSDPGSPFETTAELAIYKGVVAVDPFPVGYHNEAPNYPAGQATYLRLHHRAKRRPFVRRPHSGLYIPRGDRYALAR